MLAETVVGMSNVKTHPFPNTEMKGHVGPPENATLTTNVAWMHWYLSDFLILLKLSIAMKIWVTC
jgi:hypothetical protein